MPPIRYIDDLGVNPKLSQGEEGRGSRAPRLRTGHRASGTPETDPDLLFCPGQGPRCPGGRPMGTSPERVPPRPVPGNHGSGNTPGNVPGNGGAVPSAAWTTTPISSRPSRTTGTPSPNHLTTGRRSADGSRANRHLATWRLRLTCRGGALVPEPSGPEGGEPQLAALGGPLCAQWSLAWDKPPPISCRSVRRRSRSPGLLRDENCRRAVDSVAVTVDQHDGALRSLARWATEAAPLSSMASAPTHRGGVHPPVR